MKPIKIAILILFAISASTTAEAGSIRNEGTNYSYTPVYQIQQNYTQPVQYTQPTQYQPARPVQTAPAQPKRPGVLNHDDFIEAFLNSVPNADYNVQNNANYTNTPLTNYSYPTNNSNNYNNRVYERQPSNYNNNQYTNSQPKNYNNTTNTDIIDAATQGIINTILKY